MPLSQFLLNEATAGKELDQPEGRAKALFDAKPLLQALPANALRAQIMHMFADRLQIPFDEVTALAEVDARIAAPARQAPARNERRRVTESEKRALRNLVMHPRIAAAIDDESVATLRALPRIGELFDEVIGHARAWGRGGIPAFVRRATQFGQRADLRRNFPGNSGL